MRHYAAFLFAQISRITEILRHAPKLPRPSCSLGVLCGIPDKISPCAAILAPRTSSAFLFRSRQSPALCRAPDPCRIASTGAVSRLTCGASAADCANMRFEKKNINEKRKPPISHRRFPYYNSLFSRIMRMLRIVTRWLLYLREYQR